MLMNIINILFIFVVIFVLAYIFGMVLINIIDERLTKLTNTTEPFSNNNSKTVESKSKEEETPKILYKKKDESERIVTEEKNKDFTFDEEYYQQMAKDKKIHGFEDKSEFKPWKIEKKDMPVCFKNHEHIKDGSSLDCSYGVTNYADPYDMSPMDHNLFMLNYPRNMTLQDYINWLYCFVGKEDELPYNHLKNLEKMKMGKKLVYEEGVLPPPAYYYPPLTSEDYFDKMYNNDEQLNIDKDEIKNIVDNVANEIIDEQVNKYIEYEIPNINKETLNEIDNEINKVIDEYINEIIDKVLPVIDENEIIDKNDTYEIK
jgi:hypothetical protein